MSILFDRGRVRIDLGTGDVGIHFGGKRDVGVIGFVPSEARPIGERNRVIVNSAQEFPVSIYFHDPKSIDVLIARLEEVKAIMTARTEKPAETMEETL